MNLIERNDLSFFQSSLNFGDESSRDLKLQLCKLKQK